MRYRAVDRAGNVEAAHDAFVNLDLTAPQVSSSADGDAAWHNADVDVTLTSGDEGGSGLAAVQYRRAGEPAWTDVTGAGFTVAAAGEAGPVTYQYRAEDGAGSETTGSFTLSFDSVAPQTTDDYAGGSAWQTGDVHFSLSPTDETSGVAGTTWSVDGDTPQSGTDVTVTGDGAHTVTYSSTDLAGNPEAAHSVTVMIDAHGAGDHRRLRRRQRLADRRRALHAQPDRRDVRRRRHQLVGRRRDAAERHQRQRDRRRRTHCDLREHRRSPVIPRPSTASPSRSTRRPRRPPTTPTRPWRPTATAAGPDRPDRDPRGRRRRRQRARRHVLHARRRAARLHRPVRGLRRRQPRDHLVVDGRGGQRRGRAHRLRQRLGHRPATSANAVVTAAADEGWSEAPQPVSLTATGGHGAVTVHYILDGDPQADVSGDAAFDVSGDGRHTLEYWATDALGNEETHHTGHVDIDTASPETNDDYAGGSAWQTGPVSFTLAADDATSGVDGTSWSVDGQAAHSGADVLVTGDGEHTVTYASTDNGRQRRDAAQRHREDRRRLARDGRRRAGRLAQRRHHGDALAGRRVLRHDRRPRRHHLGLDGGATTAGTSVLVAAPADHSGDGARTITYRSTDAAGNAETTRTATVLVDTLAPVTRDDLTGGPSGHADPVTVTLSAEDEHETLDVSGVAATHYRVDDGPWQTGTSVEVTGDGEHTVSYYSTDNAGNDEAVKQSTSVSIATTPPGASSDDAPAGWTPPGHVTLTPGARALRTTWELDGGATQTGTSVAVGAPADHSGDGVHTVTYRSWAYGDVAEPSAPPWSASTRPPRRDERQRPGRLASGAVTVTLSPSDARSGVAATTWSLDGGAAHSGTSVPVSGDGVHVISYSSTDNAGNTEASHTATVRIDGTAPAASCAEAGRWFKTPAVTATIAASDTAGSGVATVEYRVDTGDWQTGASAALSGAGAHAVSYRVTDAAGNVTSGQCVVGIDTRPADQGQGARVQGQEGQADAQVQDQRPQAGLRRRDGEQDRRHHGQGQEGQDHQGPQGHGRDQRQGQARREEEAEEGHLPLQGLRHRHRRQHEQEGDAGQADGQ